jgi:hypothetical protein
VIFSLNEASDERVGYSTGRVFNDLIDDFTKSDLNNFGTILTFLKAL